MQSNIVGTRIREHRRQQNIPQGELARHIGISPSYLNLIEWNKRRVPGQLLSKVADALNVTVEVLEGASERRLHERLTEIAQLPELEHEQVESQLTGEFIARFPGWARATATLARSQREATYRARILSERLSNDPYLNESVHRMLTRIAAVRSAADILTNYSDLREQRRSRFNQIVFEESQALSEVGEALAAYLDKADDVDQVLTPVDEVEALFEHHNNRFEELERAAESLDVRSFEYSPSSRRRMAIDLTKQRLGHQLDEIVRDREPAMTAAAQRRALIKLEAYAAEAILMPSTLFLEQAQVTSFDIERLADSFAVEEEAVIRRLTALPNAEGIPQFGYIQANAAGTILDMLAIKALSLPRYASACPLWALYRTQQAPEFYISQRALFPSGERFIFIAKALQVGKSGFNHAKHYMSHMLVMTERDAAHTVYAPDRSAPIEEVGPSCRLCPRIQCGHRVEDPISG